MENFDSLGLPQALMRSLESMKFTTPTPIQAQAIPHALQGRDILGSAQTGTGKTAAFGIPLITRLLNAPRGSALVMTPTRELAVQVMEMLKLLLGKGTPIRTALLIGGEAMPKQFEQLRARPRIIVGTPGRINDHLERGTLMLHDTDFLVLDETDRMLDLGFGVQIERIAKFLTQPKRQTLLFSATLPDNIVNLSRKYLNDPVRVSVDPVTSTAPKILQEVVHTTDGDKYNQLIKELETRTGSVIIFVKTKRGADRLADKLRRQNHSADAIHGDLKQSKRDRVILAFRNRQHRILVATDIAARGLDIPHIEHVINFDLPQCPEDYIHRIGRTARAGAEGSAICFVTSADALKWRAIQRMLNPGEKFSNGAGGASEPSDNNNRPHRGRGGNGNRNHRGGSSANAGKGGNSGKPAGGFQRRKKSGFAPRRAAPSAAA